MYFINQEKKKFVNSVNQIIEKPITLEYAIEDVYLQFKILNKNSQKVAIANSDEFYLAVSTDYLPKRVCVYSNEYTIESNSIIFKVNTNTSEYVQDIKQHNSTVNIEIGRKQAADESYHIILQDKILANKRVYVVGQPNPVDADKFYTEDETNAIISNAVTALKQYVIQVVNSNSGLKYEVVSTLPDVSNAKENTIYLIPENSNSGVDLHQLLMQGGGALPQFSGINGTNIFDEYLLVNHRWECIGNTKVDLTGFVKVNSNSKIDNALLNLNGYIFSNSKAEIKDNQNNLMFDVKSNSFIVRKPSFNQYGDEQEHLFTVDGDGLSYKYHFMESGWSDPIFTVNENGLNYNNYDEEILGFSVNTQNGTFKIGNDLSYIYNDGNSVENKDIVINVDYRNVETWEIDYGAEYRFTPQGLQLPFLVAPAVNGYDQSYRIALRTFQPNNDNQPENRWGGISFVLQKNTDGQWRNWGIIFNVECNGEGNVNFARPQGNGNDVTNNSLGEIWDPDGWQEQGGDDPGDQGWWQECPDCGEWVNRDETDYCDNCGHDFNDYDQWLQECPDCGEMVNRDSDTVCPNCGYDFQGGDWGDDQQEQPEQ